MREISKSRKSLPSQILQRVSKSSGALCCFHLHALTISPHLSPSHSPNLILPAQELHCCYGGCSTQFSSYIKLLSAQPECDSLRQLSHNLPQMCCFLSPHNHHHQHWLAFINNFLFYSKQLVMVSQAQIRSHCKGFSKYNFPHLQISIFGLELQVKSIQRWGHTASRGITWLPTKSRGFWWTDSGVESCGLSLVGFVWFLFLFIYFFQEQARLSWLSYTWNWVQWLLELCFQDLQYRYVIFLFVCTE